MNSGSKSNLKLDKETQEGLTKSVVDRFMLTAMVGLILIMNYGYNTVKTFYSPDGDPVMYVIVVVNGPHLSFRGLDLA